ncbi:MAG: hemerythrin domain-containing protein [Sphingomonadales bacterium]|nr:hemerythrin domain-containing protein [Sphingomonadales bacterium]
MKEVSRIVPVLPLNRYLQCRLAGVATAGKHEAADSRGCVLNPFCAARSERHSVTQTQAVDPVSLTEHIETRFHARHREQLPRLVELAGKVEAVHAAAPEAPHGLAAALRQLLGELEVHMRKEELILFPAMRRGGMPGIEHPISVMRADHDDHVIELARIRELAGGLVLPVGACGTWTALYAGLAEFLDDFEEHLRIENDTLFPMFER